MHRPMPRLFAALSFAVASAAAGALTIELPAETAKLQPGPHLDLATARCLICHSADYIATQPPNLPRTTWAAEVAKMKKVYGAPIADEDVEPLTEYLAKTYGDERGK